MKVFYFFRSSLLFNRQVSILWLGFFFLLLSHNLFAARYSSSNVVQLNIGQTLIPGTSSHPIIRLNVIGTGANSTQSWSINSLTFQLTNPTIYDKASLLYAVNSTSISNAILISTINNPSTNLQFQNLNSFSTFSGSTASSISFFIVVDIKSGINCDSSIVDALVPTGGINIAGSGGGIKTPSPNNPSSSAVLATAVIPTIYISSSATNICSGEQISFNSITNNAGTTPSYQWILNNDSVSNSVNFSSRNFSNGDSIKCILTSTNVCAVPKTINSNIIGISVNEPPLASLNLTGKQSVCSPSSSLTLRAASNQSPVSYQWKKDNINIPNVIIDSLVATISGNYTIKITNNTTGCFSESSITTIAFGTSPNIIASANSTLECPSSELILTAVNNTNYDHTFSNSSTVSIPDFNINGINSLISVSGLPLEMKDVKIAVTLTASHNWNSDLEFYLIRPNGNLSAGYGASMHNTISGESIILAADVGDGGKNFSNLTLSDTAQASINTFAGVNVSNISGNFKPTNPFSSLSGNPNGTWILKVCDDEAVDVGSLTGWTIKFTINDSTSYVWTSAPSGFISANKNAIAPSISATTKFNLVAIDQYTGCSSSSEITIYTDSIKPTIICKNANLYLNNFGVAVATDSIVNNGSFDNCELALSLSKNTFDSSNIGTNQVYLIGMDATGNVDSCLTNINIVNNATTCILNLKLFLQGYYLGNQQMRTYLYNNGLSSNPRDVDTVEVILQNTFAPFNIISNQSAILKSNGELLVNFPLSMIGSNCYIGIRHRSSLITFSKNPILLKQFNSFNFSN